MLAAGLEPKGPAPTARVRWLRPRVPGVRGSRFKARSRRPGPGSGMTASTIEAIAKAAWVGFG